MLGVFESVVIIFGVVNLVFAVASILVDIMLPFLRPVWLAARGLALVDRELELFHDVERSQNPTDAYEGR
jgi:hypothetical protein